ncbi:helix-turn-helix domain-containing protein [Streptomyces sp. NPDC052043]|uniref:helix-turn-helix domain-containing protein n=1 Tax=Streptomyces sp. NPDC052043 TaxID=3365684 RepID=UPI0037D451F9
MARGCGRPPPTVTPARIARETGLHLDTVRRWRRRFAEQGLAGLQDRQRSGRPTSTDPDDLVARLDRHTADRPERFSVALTA